VGWNAYRHEALSSQPHTTSYPLKSPSTTPHLPQKACKCLVPQVPAVQKELYLHEQRRYGGVLSVVGAAVLLSFTFIRFLL
jgi:hypothetical protein